MWDLIAGAFILAVIFMLVRPNSPAANAVNDVSDALAALIATAVGHTVTLTGTGGSETVYGYPGNFLPNPSA